MHMLTVQTYGKPHYRTRRYSFERVRLVMAVMKLRGAGGAAAPGAGFRKAQN